MCRALPLVAVITPTTLTVEISPHPNDTIVEIPIANIRYDDMQTFAESTISNTQGYNSPSSHVLRLLSAVASTGVILEIPAPFPNSSYSVDFSGPTISCGSPASNLLTRQIADIISNNTWYYNLVGYVGFVPSYLFSEYRRTNNSTGEDPILRGLRGALDLSGISSMPSYDQSHKTDAATFYVVVPPDTPYPGTNMYPYAPANKTIECALYNSSYSANFKFDNGKQTINFTTQKLHGVSMQDLDDCTVEFVNHCPPTIPYISLLDALGKILLGVLQKSRNGSILPSMTQIMSSVLMDTQEMQPIRYMQTLRDRQVPRYVRPGVGYEPPQEAPTVNITISEALEEVFANATLSMFSDPAFL